MHAGQLMNVTQYCIVHGRIDVELVVLQRFVMGLTVANEPSLAYALCQTGTLHHPWTTCCCHMHMKKRHDC